MAEEEKEQEAGAEEEKKDAAAEGEGNGGEAASPKSKKKKIIILAAIILVILIAVPAGLHFSGIFPLFGSHKEKATEEEAGDEHSDEVEEATSEDEHGDTSEGGHGEEEGKDGEHAKKVKKIPNLPPPPVTLDLEEFLVNLNTPGKQARFLKMSIALELPGEAEKEAIKPYVPRIRDTFQLYLRELREEDVKGSAALYRLREELMLRLSKVVYPIKVNDILFKEILTQ